MSVERAALKAMPEAFGVREDNWRDALTGRPPFAISESPVPVGRRAAKPDRLRFTGRTLGSGELARLFGVDDMFSARCGEPG